MDVKTLLHQLVFLGTGCFSTLITQYLFYAGAAEKKTFITVFAQYFAMTLSVFIPIGSKNPKSKTSFFSKPKHIKRNIIIVNII